MRAWRLGVSGAVGGAVVGGVLLLSDAARANGGVHKGIELTGSVTFGDSGRVELRCEIAPVLYRATSLGRYRVLQITVHNVGRVALPMSKSGDALTLVYPSDHGREVKAVLDLGAREPSLWSKLSLELRNDLAYPTGVPPGEDETVFAFVPVSAPASPPERILLTLAGLPGRIIELRERRATAD